MDGGDRLAAVCDGVGVRPEDARMVGDYLLTRDGAVWSLKRGPARRLRPCPDGAGQPRVRIDGRSVPMCRLMLETFVGPCPPGHEAQHADLDPMNWHLDNLSWGTRAESIARRQARGAAPSGLTPEQAEEVRRLFAEGHTTAEIGARFGVAPSTAWKAVKRRGPYADPA